MLALAHHFDELLTSPDGTYRARVYGQVQEDGMWGGWLVFFPVPGGRVIATDRETTQSSLANLSYWASGLTHLYLHGALERALELQPEAQLARELDQLERLEASAEARAETLESAASAARAESRLAEVARERTEERLLGAIAETADEEAEALEQAARQARSEAAAADRARQEPKRGTSSKPAKSSKKTKSSKQSSKK
jgi:hypothetical protein